MMYVRGLLLAVVFCLAATVALAGDMDPPGAPAEAAGAMHSITDVYNRIDDGTEGTLRTTTVGEPSAAPGATGRTLTEVYDLASERSRPPETGQTVPYESGDDGDLQKGVFWPSVRFTDNGDGTVTDHLTGLVWLQRADYSGTEETTGTASWSAAISFCNTLESGVCGLSDGSVAGDWRLPNARELFSLIDLGNADDPALPSGHPFTNVQSFRYWTSTTSAADDANAWVVNLLVGTVRNDAEKEGVAAYVWPVRGSKVGFECPDGYEFYIDDDTYRTGVCMDLNECTDGTDDCDENATCTNTCGGYTCTCNDNYQGDGTTCDIIHHTCYGTRADESGVCGDKGQCVAEDTCECENGWGGDECDTELTCPGGGDCNGNGKCVDDGDGDTVGVCECYNPYYGTDCGDCLICIQDGAYAYACESSGICGDYGECVFNPDSDIPQIGVCQCEEGVEGEECETDLRYCYNIYYLDEDICNGRGDCVYMEIYEQYGCDCYDGYDGGRCYVAKCETTSNGVCNGHGDCIKDDECKCDFPYTGDACTEVVTCFDVDHDADDVCSGHGTCTAVDTCVCDAGYAGKACNIPIVCNP